MQFKNILAASLLSMAAAQLRVNPPAAIAVYDNPTDKAYAAIFDGTGNVAGKITFKAGKGGAGVDISVQLKGFEGSPGPFGYHIHDQPVPADGNCTATKAHLDPNGRGQLTPCDASHPETCEVGDLAGKHGKIPASTTELGYVAFEQSYNELYATIKEGVGAFLGNRSIVIHRADATKSRLACANIMLISGGGAGHDSTTYASSTTASYAPSYTSTGTGTGSNVTLSTKSATASTSTPNALETILHSGSSITFGVSPLVAVGGLVAGLMMAL